MMLFYQPANAGNNRLGGCNLETDVTFHRYRIRCSGAGHSL